jgi:D-beta-D-heptose 7-phosphate kinase/D-beta-D-heptose 1-phosphate adenosyltransferase
MAACLLALLAGANLADTADLATAAAALVVRQSETAICEQDELLTSIAAGNKLIATVALLKTFCRIYRNQGKRIVFTNGCFDILHSGHVSYLARAKEMGDILIVGLNTDESIRRLKGKGRPVNELHGRSAVLSALNCVDHVVSFGKAGDDTPISLINAVRPAVFVKGGDYQNKVLPEGAVLKAMGCEVVFLSYLPGQSTTRMITKIEENVKWKIAVMN